MVDYAREIDNYDMVGASEKYAENRLALAVNRRVVGSSPTCGANSSWVYILQNPRGTFYVGQTEDLDARVAFHSRTDKIDGHFTRKNGDPEGAFCNRHGCRPLPRAHFLIDP